MRGFRLATCLSALLAAAPAAAVPPPPPPAADLNTGQAYIHALVTRDGGEYAGLLSDAFAGYGLDGRIGPVGRAAWLESMRAAFGQPGFGARILHAFYGGTSMHGPFRNQLMLVEQVANVALRDGIPGDCCIYYLTETLTFDHGRIIRIDRSPLYDNELSQGGRRTDIP